MTDDSGGVRQAGIESLLGRQRRILELTEKVIWHVDLEAMTVTYFGPVEALTGVPADAAADPLLANPAIIHPADQAVVFEAHESLLSGSRDRLSVEFRTHPDAGEVRWIRNRSFLVNPGADEPSALVGLAADVTDEYAADPSSTATVRTDSLGDAPGGDDAGSLPGETAEAADVPGLPLEDEGLRTLILDLLTYVEATERTAAESTMDLATVAAESWDAVETGDATLACDVDLTVTANAPRFRHLLETLFRFVTEDGDPGAAVSVTALDDGFAVGYDAASVTAESLDALVHSDATVVSPGTRLGLLFVSRIVAAEGWAIDVREAGTEGVRFEITTEPGA